MTPEELHAFTESRRIYPKPFGYSRWRVLARKLSADKLVEAIEAHSYIRSEYDFYGGWNHACMERSEVLRIVFEDDRVSVEKFVAALVKLEGPHWSDWILLQVLRYRRHAMSTDEKRYVARAILDGWLHRGEVDEYVPPGINGAA